MKEDGGEMTALREVLGRLCQGKGLSGALVEVFTGKKADLREAARLSLLGHPPEVSLASTLKSSQPEVSMLAELIVGGAKTDAWLVGKRGGEVALTLEKWVKAREGRRMEMKVMAFRSIVMASILGGVMAMVSTLAPVVGAVSLGGESSATDTNLVVYVGAAMACLSSGVLGYYTSGRRFLLNIALTLAVFAVVATAISPLASIPVTNLWAIK
jgi:hypothetical protein